MRLVIDTNIVMAGLLKDSSVRYILLSSGINFFLPEIALAEIDKYKGEICKRADYTEEEFYFILKEILNNISLVNKEEIKYYIFEADNIMKDIDIDDSLFIATCL